ncbi:hypothetical protein [Rubidibacter lacunae]|uniref:hypothetical protein n=1 Tax=Rubidibacter lacunae TaxID=582514 RepID=UPI0003F8C38D|nr:hypothetical protein [Rubidibacter lacunae]
MLRSLGHERAARADGGQAAIAQTRVTIAFGSAVESTPTPGNFTGRPRDTRTIALPELPVSQDYQDRIVAIDARSPSEFAGAMSFSERRTVRLPGALPLHFRE